MFSSLARTAARCWLMSGLLKYALTRAPPTVSARKAPAPSKAAAKPPASAMLRTTHKRSGTINAPTETLLKSIDAPFSAAVARRARHLAAIQRQFAFDRGDHRLLANAPHAGVV